MKNLLSLSIFFSISVQFSGYSQDPSSDRWYDYGDNTNINIPINGRINVSKDAENSYALEEFKRFRVSDAQYDFLSIRNATVTDNIFIPWIFGHNQTDSRVSLFISGVTNYNNDIGNAPLIVFDARKYYDPSSSLAGGSSVYNRSLFQWRNYVTNYMTLSANGSLGIGTEAPQAQLHTTGSVRFEGLSSNIGNSVIMSDYWGNISRYALPSSSFMAVTTSSPTTYSLPRFNSSNVLVNSQIFDNGTNIGIGGSPAANAKVTVYGVVNTLSDKRFKTNIHPINNALDVIKNINGYFYNWQKGMANVGTNTEIGLLAQEVAKVLPEAVSQNQEGTFFLNYNAIIPVLTEAVKAQQQIISTQNQRIDNLENELKELKKIVRELAKK
ncbi:tail fiber domain-containing protein [Emticicia sp. SJ17W-69]|uniref:tail fiber domain-containing protein n=1 Tax=Emticicia sp. SJ17W-69 TaxID=3421657 RepID=UPI003EBF5E33